MFTEFELLTDPLRNYRAYRVAVGKLQPPVLPFVLLLIKGKCFATHFAINWGQIQIWAWCMKVTKPSRTVQSTLKRCTCWRHHCERYGTLVLGTWCSSPHRQKARPLCALTSRACGQSTTKNNQPACRTNWSPGALNSHTQNKKCYPLGYLLSAEDQFFVVVIVQVTKHQS